jgi:drug/metabolite transporter (DMT)-like permease
MSQAVIPKRLPDAGDALYRRGALLVAGATLVWSSAGLLARWGQTDPWTTLFWRSVFAAAALLGYLAWREGRDVWRGFRRLGSAGLTMALCFAASMICFINALSLTTVAAVLVFQAAAPLFAALLAWIFLSERVGGVKLAAVLVTLAAVVFMVSGTQDLGGWWGNLLSAVMGITFAATIVLARAEPDVPTTEATCVAVMLVALVSLPFAQLNIGGPDLALLALFGIAQMGLALVMFTVGVRLIPSVDAGLISVLESVLGPLWVWIAFDENPGVRTLVGGFVVVCAVVAAARSTPG